jgi:hypothetical protein
MRTYIAATRNELKSQRCTPYPATTFVFIIVLCRREREDEELQFLN